MNKYTLRFKDQEIEKKYQNHKVKDIQFPTLTYLTLGGTPLLLIYAITNLINIDYTNALINGIFFVYMLMQYLVLRKNEYIRVNYCDLALMLTNFGSLYYEISPKQYDYYNGYIMGSNQMLIHTLLMFACNLEIGVFSNLVLTVVRVILAVENSENMSLLQYLQTVIMACSFIIVQYQIEKQFRDSYLLSLKDNTWEILIPQLLNKPFFIFAFNQEVNMYQAIMSNQNQFFNSDSPLTTFLFQSKVKKKSLEAYLVKKSNQKGNFSKLPCLFNQQVNLEYQLKKLQVSVIGCKFEKIIYAVIIDSEDPLLRESKIKFNQSLQQCKDILNAQILQINKVLTLYLSETYSSLIRNLRISLYEIYYKQVDHKKVQLVKMKKLLIKCQRIFETPTNKIKIDCQEQIKFATIKSTLIIFIFEILKLIEGNQQVFLLVNQNITTKLFVYGLKDLPRSALFEESKKVLVEQTMYTAQYYSFEFMRSPQSTFNYENQIKQESIA
ncbi:unnamed protein product [Paramecium primaurelia]|uniref:Transmembrane protein n=1 Tax=Paramecium primaurelia TaxID=5886 RepID=A0A8S1NFF5_PARPR|nr:unnamed protein product [Paramecium primaurelia]